jgi:para-aminobenzoate synthetase component 1
VNPFEISVRLQSSDTAAAWNFTGPARRCIWADARTGESFLSSGAGIERRWDNPLEALRWMASSLIDPAARWIGFLSYDLGRWFENLPAHAADDLGLPLFVFSLHSNSGTSSRSSSIRREVSKTTSSNFTQAEYEAAVARVIEYIAAGDVFQVNLSQRVTIFGADDPHEIFSRLPVAAYGALLDYGDFALLCNSPELFVRVSADRRIVTRPIKGTRLLSEGMDRELRESIKDQAELNMIVDLERNDLGRICTIGSVKVVEPRKIEAHQTVYHGVAGIEGQLREEVGFVDILRATFPGGSVTGAPKIRAMQIIDELEGVRRGPYCGAIGYIAGDGTMEFNVAIRTMIAEGGRVHVPVGGGIVADSNPHDEYLETLVKAKAMFAALGAELPKL